MIQMRTVLCALAPILIAAALLPADPVLGAPTMQMVPPGKAMVRGTVVNTTADSVYVRTPKGVAVVKIVGRLHVFARKPSSMSRVRNHTFIGVTTVPGPNGTQRATEIHIFPEALRGLGEGSHLMNAAATPRSRMTNGSVSTARGTVYHPRMTNGSVRHTGGSTMVVSYNGGSQKIVVPAGIPVTEFKPTSKQPAPGDRIFFMANKARDGSLSASTAVLVGK